MAAMKRVRKRPAQSPAASSRIRKRPAAVVPFADQPVAAVPDNMRDVHPSQRVMRKSDRTEDTVLVHDGETQSIVKVNVAMSDKELKDFGFWPEHWLTKILTPGQMQDVLQTPKEFQPKVHQLCTTIWNRPLTSFN